jgi:mRNA-degrading endonuclease RelE of RelBE toxin-antitoxin system
VLSAALIKNGQHTILFTSPSDGVKYKIKNLKKLTGYDTYYRIRIGDYRLGIKVDGETVYFVVIEHRKDIYKGFP